MTLTDAEFGLSAQGLIAFLWAGVSDEEMFRDFPTISVWYDLLEDPLYLAPEKSSDENGVFICRL